MHMLFINQINNKFLTFKIKIKIGGYKLIIKNIYKFIIYKVSTYIKFDKELFTLLYNNFYF